MTRPWGASRILMAGWLAVSALPVAGLPAAAQNPLAEQVDITARQIRGFRIGSEETRFGPFEFVGGLELTSSGWDFGSLSAFRFREAGKDMIGVTDTGFWFFGRLEHDSQGRPAGVADAVMMPMVDEAGKPVREKWYVDAEGIALDGDKAVVSFEREHRIAEFDIRPGDMRAATRNLDYLVPSRELRQNRGFETVTVSDPAGPHRGAMVIVAEKSIDKAGNVFAAILGGPEKGVFTVKRNDGFDITDGEFLPGGDLLLLERSYSIATGVAMRLRRIEAATIRKGGLADGPVLMEADMGYQIDNMEGLDVWRREDGALMVSLISDDNHSLLQRNLYLEFRFDEE